MNKIVIIGIIIAVVIGGITLFYLDNNLATNGKTPNPVNVTSPAPTVNVTSPAPIGKHYTILLNESMGIRNP